MTRPQLVTRNLLRNRRRMILTFLSIVTSITLLAVFCAVYRFLDNPPLPAPWRLVLTVAARTSLLLRLPLSYAERIARLPGVAAVTPVSMVDCLYGGKDAVTVALILRVAIAIGLASTLIPAYRASRMSIADALRYVG